MDHDTELEASWRVANKVHPRLLYPMMLAIPAAGVFGMGMACLVTTLFDVWLHGFGALSILAAIGQFTLWVIASLFIVPQLLYSLVIPLRTRSLRYNDDHLFVRRDGRISRLPWDEVLSCGDASICAIQDQLWANLVPKDIVILFRSGDRIRLPSRIAIPAPMSTILAEAARCDSDSGSTVDS